MREFLFRAYDKGRKEYLSDGHLFIAINKSKHPNISEIYLDKISNHDKYKERFVIEEYTGQIDKNGKKIFEGDLLLDGNLIWVVAFENGAFVCKDENFKTFFNFYEHSGYDTKTKSRKSYISEYVVIGNIHDNPELLKGGVKE